MPCTSPDGKPTESGVATLKAIKDGAASPQEIAVKTGRPLFLVRSGLRELVAAGFLRLDGERHALTAEGENASQ